MRTCRHRTPIDCVPLIVSFHYFAHFRWEEEVSAVIGSVGNIGSATCGSSRQQLPLRGPAADGSCLLAGIVVYAWFPRQQLPTLEDLRQMGPVFLLGSFSSLGPRGSSYLRGPAADRARLLAGVVDGHVTAAPDGVISPRLLTAVQQHVMGRVLGGIRLETHCR